MKFFYIFRHGETDWNRQRRCQGHTDIELNQQGHTQAQILGEKLAHIPFEIIYTSDLKRAQTTADYVASHHQVPLMATPLLRETNMGQAEGLTVDEITQKFGGEFWQNFRFQDERSLDLGFPEGETRRASLQRLRGFVESLLETEHTHIGLSTHGGALRSLLHSFLPDGTRALEIPNCVVYQLMYEAGEWSVKGPL